MFDTDWMKFDRKLIETIPVPVFYKDINGIYIGCNKAFEVYLGKEKKEIIGKSVFDLSSPELAEKYRSMDEVLFLETDQQFYESKVVTADGTQKNVIFYKSAIKDDEGKKIGLVGVIMDITELKALSDLKNQIFAIIAHDLRLPLGSSKGLLKMLIDEYDGLETREIKELLNEILHSQENVFELLEKMLLWARAQQNQLERNIEVVEINGLIHDIVDIYKHAASHKSQKIALESKSTRINVHADRQILETAVRNLLSNAIKYTGESGFIIVRTKEREDGIYIEVEDDGIGVKVDTIEALMDLTHNTKNFGTGGEIGTGFGLRLTKELIEKSGGTLSLIKKEVGSIFVIKLEGAHIESA